MFICPLHQRTVSLKYLRKLRGIVTGAHTHTPEKSDVDPNTNGDVRGGDINFRKMPFVLYLTIIL